MKKEKAQPKQKPEKKEKDKNSGNAVTWEDLIMNFSFEKLTRLSEKQFIVLFMVVAGIFIASYMYLQPKSVAMYDDGLGLAADMLKKETAEEKFKRENKNIKLPDGSALTPDFIAKQTKLEKNIPFGDKQMEYIVRLPVNWRQSNFAKYGLPGEEDYSILTNIARYFGPAIEDQLPFFWLEVEKLRRFLTAESYLRSYMIKRGTVPETIIVRSETEAEALYIDSRDNRSYAVRSIFRMEGPYVIMATVGAPVQFYSEYKDVMGLIMKSFDLVNPIPGQIEKINTHKLLNVLKFDYYDSWQIRNEQAQTALNPSTELHNILEVEFDNRTRGANRGLAIKKEPVQGLIFVNAWRVRNAHKAQNPMDVINAKLADIKHVLDPTPLETKQLTLKSDFNSIEQRQYRALVDRYVRQDEFDIIMSEETKTENEVWVTVMDNGYYSVWLTMITPLRDTNYLTWAKNKAAYDLLIRSITVRSAPKD